MSPTVTAGEFGIVYRARLSRPTLRKAEHEIVAVKTIKGKDTRNHASMHMSTTEILFVYHMLIFYLTFMAVCLQAIVSLR